MALKTFKCELEIQAFTVMVEENTIILTIFNIENLFNLFFHKPLFCIIIEDYKIKLFELCFITLYDKCPGGRNAKGE